jgi:excisionase family DNA binding protein
METATSVSAALEPVDDSRNPHGTLRMRPRRVLTRTQPGIRSAMRTAVAMQPAERPSAVNGVVLLTVAETAALLRTTRKGIYAMVERQQIAGDIRIGRRVLFRRDVLLRWLDQKRAPSPQE